jgi:gliotoxin biosynthesis N-methyltransferase
LDLASSLQAPWAGTHEFVGSEINPEPSPGPGSTPSNMEFVVQDINKPWPESYIDQFDAVHQRMSLYAAGSNPSGAISHLYSVVKPDGWIQLTEASMDFPPDLVNPERTPAFLDMMKLVRSIANTTGSPPQLAKELGSLLDKAGFTDISGEEVMLRFGRTNEDEKLGRDWVRSFLITVQGNTKFAQCKLRQTSL